MTDNGRLTYKLQQLGLSKDEATVYLKLLTGKSTHLRLSRETGITRSRVYHLLELLKQRGLSSYYSDDTGNYVTASSPENLTINLTAQEEKIKEQREILQSIMPPLLQLQTARGNKAFTVSVYEGEDGFRQMLWNELKSTGEICVLGGATIEDLVPHHRWAERHRAASLAVGYSIRELHNGDSLDLPFTKINDFSEVYSERHIASDIIELSSQTVTYNDTVSIYHWRHDQKVGLEIISRQYSSMMRSIFETYWQIAS